MLFSRCLQQFSKLRRFGVEHESLPTIPKIDFPIREYLEGQDQITKEQLYQDFGYKRKQFARCRYVAVERKGKVYHIFDASRYPFGRMCNIIATEIRGKNTPLYKNNRVNEGNTCIIVNAGDPLLTGKKLLFKVFRYHTGFIGHLREIPYREVFRRKPELMYHFAIKKFMPKNSLSKNYMKNVHIFRGPTHNFSKLPQFAPDINIYEGLPEIDILEEIKKNPQAKLVDQSHPGLDREIIGRQLPLDPLPEPSTKKRPATLETKKKLRAMWNIYQKKSYRYRKVRVVTRLREQEDDDFRLIEDERKAKKRPDYAELADEDASEEDEQILKEVFLSDEAAEKDRKEEEEQEKAEEARIAALKAAQKTAANKAASKEQTKEAPKAPKKPAPKAPAADKKKK